MGTIFEQPNSKRAELIDEWIHSAKHRDIAKRHLIDGETIEEVAVILDRSPRQTSRTMERIIERLNEHL